MRGDDRNATKSRPSSARHLNGSSLADRYCPNIEFLLGRFVVFQEIRASNAKEPYSFVIFQGDRPTHSSTKRRHVILKAKTKLKQSKQNLIVLANTQNPDETARSDAFHKGHQCLQKNPF